MLGTDVSCNYDALLLVITSESTYKYEWRFLPCWKWEVNTM